MKNRKPYGDKTELIDLRRATYSIAAAINNARIGINVPAPLNCFIEKIPDYSSGDEQLDFIHWGKVYRRVYRKARRYGVPIDSIWIRKETKTKEQ